MDSNIGNITSTSELNSQTSNWTNTKIIKIGLPSAYQIARAVGDNTWSVMNAYVISNLPSWLTENLSSSSTESTNGYWTSTQASDSILVTFAVHYNAILTGTSSYTHNIDTTYKVGVRPVITVSKNDIKN